MFENFINLRSSFIENNVKTPLPYLINMMPQLDFDLPDVMGVRFRLREAFLSYYKRNLSVRQLRLPDGEFVKHLTVQSLAKTIAYRELYEKAQLTGTQILRGPSGQAVLLEQMDQDLRVLQVEGAAAVWLTHDHWRLHQNIEWLPEDLNYGLILQEFKPVLMAAYFITMAMRRDLTDSDSNEVPTRVLKHFCITDEVLSETYKRVQDAIDRISGP